MTDILKVKVNNQWVGIPAIKGTVDVNKLGLETGELSTDSEMLAELKSRYQNSTKTGVDSVIGENYTIVDSPTISSVGVASNFSNSNYLKINPVAWNDASSWDLYVKFTTGADVTTVQTLTNTISGFALLFLINSGKFRIFLSSGSTWDIANSTYCFDVSASQTYYVKISYTGTEYTVKYSTAGFDELALATTITSSTKIASDTSNRVIGNSRGTGDPFLGSIDLNEFKIYLDDNLVCQPLLRIPYTLASTSSKIVNSTYRNRVGEMYNLFGYAPYYTLSDTDFTLPKGDIYGFTTQILTEYQNGSDGYRIWKNGYCEQWGHLTSGTTVTFAKEFKDTNYNMQPYPATKSTTGCTYSSTTTDWIAKGYLKEGEY